MNKEICEEKLLSQVTGGCEFLKEYGWLVSTIVTSVVVISCAIALSCIIRKKMMVGDSLVDRSTSEGAISSIPYHDLIGFDSYDKKLIPQKNGYVNLKDIAFNQIRTGVYLVVGTGICINAKGHHVNDEGQLLDAKGNYMR